MAWNLRGSWLSTHLQIVRVPATIPNIFSRRTGLKYVTSFRYKFQGAQNFLSSQYWQSLVLPIRRQYYAVLPLSSSSDTHKAVVSSTDDKALAWRHIYDHSPSSFGLSDYWGFLSMIPVGTRLPAKKTVTLKNLEANADREDLTIQFRHTPRDVPVDVSIVRLENLRRAERGITNVKITMEMDKSLVGTFTAVDTFTRSRVSTEFDASVACHETDALDIILRKEDDTTG